MSTSLQQVVKSWEMKSTSLKVSIDYKRIRYNRILL